MRKLEDQIAQLTNRGEQLASMRIKAQGTLDDAIAAQRDRLVSGDIDDQRGLDKLRDAVVSAKTDLSSIEDALAGLARQKSETETNLATERERADRIRASGEIDTATDAIESRIEPTLSVLRDLGDALLAIDHLSYEAGQLGRYLLGAGSEVYAVALSLPEFNRPGIGLVDQAVDAGHDPSLG